MRSPCQRSQFSPCRADGLPPIAPPRKSDARSARLVHTLPNYHPLLAALGGSRRGDVDRERILRYILDVQGSARFRRVIDLLPDSDVREAAMTIAEELRKEGEQRGLLKG